MHHPKLKYNQQKWIWILMHVTCMFFSISCLKLPYFAEISLAHTFPCTTEWENHRGWIAVIKVVLITIHIRHLGSYTGEHGIWMLSFTSLLSTCIVCTHFIYMTKSLQDWGNSPRSPSLPKKDQAHFVWCWLNECWLQLHLHHCPYAKGKNYAAERQILLGPWPSLFRGYIILVAARESNTTCLVWLCEKLALYKSYQQNTTKQLKIQIMFLIQVYEHFHRLAQHQPSVEKSPSQTFCVNCPICCSHIPHTIIKPITSPRP